jgi:lipopolysaccharide transport system permease protein
VARSRSLSGPDRRRRRRRLVDIARVLVERDLTLTYGATAFGFFWAPASLLVQVAVLSVLFGELLPLGVDDYGVSLFSGLIAWNLLSTAVVAGGDAFTGNRDLVRRPGFPTIVLPVVTTLRALAVYVLVLPVLGVVLAASGRLQVTALALPLVTVLTVVLAAGPALIVATTNVRYRDVGHLVGVALNVLFYATPVFYAEGRLPDRFGWLGDVNPLAWVVGLHRQVLYDGQWPDLGRTLASAGVAALALAAGVVVHRGAEAHLADDL